MPTWWSAVPGEKDPGGSVPKGWYTRGYLPHYDEPGALQMITYRLADSLPQRALAEMEEALELLPEGRRDPFEGSRSRNGWMPGWGPVC